MPRHARAVAGFLRLVLLSLLLHLQAPAHADTAGAAAPAGPGQLEWQGRRKFLADGVREKAPTQTRGSFQGGAVFIRPTGCRVTTSERVHHRRVTTRKRVQG